MSATRWRIVKTIVGNALSMEMEERQRFVASACSHDTTLAEEVNLLLEQAELEDFLESPAELPVDEGRTVWLGRLIGPYRLVRELPAGGMGRVFEARRDDSAYDDRVAIKILMASIATPDSRRRFNSERHVLASLKHPHIAQMIDGGVVDDLPYIVMEYVSGVPCDLFCDEGGLDLRERLNLFATICQAVEYAQQRLIVHRDIKPDNILITAEGTPKLLDFGIAKMLLPELFGISTGQTAIGVIGPLTFAYAAPEQLRGEQITLAADVYSLGCILFKLLTGRLPFESDADRIAYVKEGKNEYKIDSPYEALKGLRRAYSLPNGLPPLSRMTDILRSDLDIIVRTALSDDPETRYRTVVELRDDVQRYLAGKPIKAHPMSFGYAARKLLKRNPVVVGLVFCTLVMTLAGIAVIVSQANDAERERSIAESSLRTMQAMTTKVIFDYYDKFNKIPGARDLSKKLADDSSDFLDTILGEGNLNDRLQENLAASYQRLETIQEQYASYARHNPDPGKASREKAYAIQEMLLLHSPGDPSAMGNLSATLIRMAASAERAGDSQTAEFDWRRGAKLAREAVRADAGSDDYQYALAGALYFGSFSSWRKYGGTPATLATNQEAQRILTTLAGRNSTAPRYAALLANAMAIEGLILRDGLHDEKRAMQAFERAIAIQKDLLPKSPDDVGIVVDLAWNYCRIADLDVESHAYRDAGSVLREARNLLDPMLDTQPDNRHLSIVGAIVDIEIARAAFGAGHIPLPSDDAAWNRHDVEALIASDDPSPYYAILAAMAYETKAARDWRLKKWHAAQSEYDAAMRRLQSADDGPGGLLGEMLANRFAYCLLLLDQRKTVEAKKEMTAVLQRYQARVLSSASVDAQRYARLQTLLEQVRMSRREEGVTAQASRPFGEIGDSFQLHEIALFDPVRQLNAPFRGDN